MTPRLLEDDKLTWSPLISLGFPPADLIYPESTAMGKEPRPARYEEARGRRSVGMPGGFCGIAWSSTLFIGNADANCTVFVTPVACRGYTVKPPLYILAAR